MPEQSVALDPSASLIDKIGYWATQAFQGVIEFEKVKQQGAQPTGTTRDPSAGSITGGLTVKQIVIGGVVLIGALYVIREL